MRKFISGLLLIINFIAALAIVYLVFLAPTRSYTKASVDSSTLDIKKVLLSSMPKSFSLEDRKIKAAITLKEKDINNMIISNLNTKGDIVGVETIIDKNRMEIYICKKFLDLIPIEATVFFSGKIEDDKAKLILEDSRLGKLELDKTKILDQLKKSNLPFLDIRPLSSEIILEDKELSSVVEIMKLSLEEKALSADVEIKVNSLQDFMKIVDILGK